MVKTFMEASPAETDFSSIDKSTDIMTADSLDKDVENDDVGGVGDSPKKSLEIIFGDASDASTEVSPGSGSGILLPSSRSPRMEGLSAVVGSSLRSIQSAGSALSHMVNAFVQVHMAPKTPFPITAKDLGDLSNERTHQALATVLEKAAANLPPCAPGDEEELKSARVRIEALVKRIGESSAGGEEDGHDNSINKKSDSMDELQREHDMEHAANALATVILRSKPEDGITNDASDIEFRREAFGTNAIADKKTRFISQIVLERRSRFCPHNAHCSGYHWARCGDDDIGGWGEMWSVLAGRVCYPLVSFNCGSRHSRH